MTGAAALFEVLSDPTRRHLVEHLRDGERSVGDLVDEVGGSQPGVSQHLRVLREAGFVQVRAQGQRRLYSLRPEPFRDLARWADDYRQLVDARLDRVEDLLADAGSSSRSPRGRSAGKRT